ncbi:MAG: alpha/beta hydrolase family protein, partial [Candidatus Marinimicrobia bacterium]|nr:alpha/beta hydrolase family protein [Candidatus Neomarinimicrobiota bacterium]
TEIRSAGQQLMDLPLGIIELKNGALRNDSILVVAVDGYDSPGYEWITGLKNLAGYYGSVFFFRYDWEACPDQIAHVLASEIKQIEKSGDYKKLIIFGHSYGGMVVTFAASELGKLPTDIHVIAAPLSGFPNLLDECSNLSYDSGDKLKYPKWKESVHLIQHRTVHAQDGAFRDLASDPQDIDLPFYQIFELPPTMDGHRLGHNWSVTWVLDKHIGKPHRL